MKRRIIAGRDQNKQYKSIRFSGWTKTKDSIVEHANHALSSGLNRKNTDELKRYVRYAISEAEAAAAKLNEYREILEQFNKTSCSSNDIQTLIDELDSLVFKQEH